MIDLYTWKTPNGRKISIMLEELGIAYRVHPIDISNKEQFSTEFLRINPNHKIPAIVDHDGPNQQSFALFESGAILIYLAEKTGQYLSHDTAQRAITLQWLMFQMSAVGPMLGQVHHFMHYASEKIPYAIERYTNEAKRIYGVLDQRLSETEYLAGDYSIADIATFPWITLHANQEIDLQYFPHVKRWHDVIAARPAVKIGMQIP